jgi:hypothetical protein
LLFHDEAESFHWLFVSFVALVWWSWVLPLVGCLFSLLGGAGLRRDEAESFHWLFVCFRCLLVLGSGGPWLVLWSWVLPLVVVCLFSLLVGARLRRPLTCTLKLSPSIGCSFVFVACWC